MFNFRLESYKYKTGDYGDVGSIGDEKLYHLYVRDQECQQTLVFQCFKLL